MKFTIEIDSEKNPDAVGEYLRSMFFAEDKNDAWSVGCYSVFDWREEVEPLPDTHEEEKVCQQCREVEAEMAASPGQIVWRDGECNCTCTREAHWTRGKKTFYSTDSALGTIECRWYWDGDGILAFMLPAGEILVNSDCKKGYGWKIVYSWKEC